MVCLLVGKKFHDLQQSLICLVQLGSSFALANDVWQKLCSRVVPNESEPAVNTISTFLCSEILIDPVTDGFISL